MNQMFKYVRIEKNKLKPLIIEYDESSFVKKLLSEFKIIFSNIFDTAYTYHYNVFPFGNFYLLFAGDDLEDFLNSKNIEFEKISYPFEIFSCGLSLKIG